MAATTLQFPLLLLVLLFAATASARPCKTLFFFTSTSYYPLPDTDSQNPNPYFPFFAQNNDHPRYLTFFFTSTSTFNPNDNDKANPKNFRCFFFNRNTINSPLLFDRVENDQQQIQEEEEENQSLSALPFTFYPSVRSSMRDRTKDIVSVVGALLFGMGCGALTAATMYLIWSLFMPDRFEFDDSDDEFDGGDDDVDVDPKKMMGGYVAIPTKVVDDDDLKKPGNVAVAKEVV